METNSNERFLVSSYALLQHFNLSGNKALRTLETTGESIHVAVDTAANFLQTALSSVTSPVPLDVVIVYRDYEICGRQDRDLESICLFHSSQEIWDRNFPYYQRQLRVFRDMYSTQDFRLVLCADVPDSMVKHALEILRRVVEVGKVVGGVGHLYEPLVISERRTLLTRDWDLSAGYSRGWFVRASAL